MDELLVVLTTFEDEAGALEVARELVERRLAACAQVGGVPVHSFWHWEGVVESGREWAVSFKVPASGLDALREELHRLHPYSVPQFVVLRGEASTAYAQWARDACTP